MENFEERWEKVEDTLQKRFDKEPDVKAILFIIGLRELGTKKNKFSKEEKQDLMNLAFCRISSKDGYFDIDHLDGDGLPIYKQVKPLPPMNQKEQEQFIMENIIHYFEEEGLIS